MVILFSAVLSNGLVWDDIIAFEHGSRYQGTDHIYDIFFEPLIFSNDYYRPVVSSTFAIQNQIFGVSPQGLHLFSLVLHAINTFLVSIVSFLLLKKWYPGDSPVRGSLIAGIFYGLHPALIEPVVFISARFDLMVAFFTLTAMISSLVLRNILAKSFSVGAFFLCAALSKEMALGFAVALPLWLLLIETDLPPTLNNAWKRLLRKDCLAVIGFTVLAGVVYLILRTYALQNLINSENLLKNAPLGIKALLVIRSLFEYVSLVLLPFGNISPAHPIESPISLSDHRNLVSLGIIPFLIGAVLLLNKYNKRAVLLFVMGLLSLAPVLGIFPLSKPTDLYFSEWYLPLPMIFFSLFSMVLITSFLKSRQIAQRSTRYAVFFAGSLWLTLSVYSIITTVPLWKNELILWTWVSTKKPELVMPRVNLGIAYLNAGKYQQALETIARVLKSDPGNAFAWNKKGNILRRMGEKSGSLDSHYKSVIIEPDNIGYWLDLAVSLSRFDEPEPARKVLVNEVISKEPDNWRANAQLGFIYTGWGKHQLAKQYFLRSLKYAPSGKSRKLIQNSLDRLPG